MEIFVCLIMLGVLFLTCYNTFYRPFIEPKIQKKLDEEKRRFENGEMSAEERKNYVNKQLSQISQMYNSGQLSLLEYEALKKKYTGESFLLDYGGLEYTVAASNKVAAERAVAKQKKKAENDLIFQTSVGSAVNGTAGAIIGAASSARNSAKEAADLEAKRAAAEEAYQKALKNVGKK